ncbi:MAG: transglycosylase SLT domain-containing protein [Alphaproteobacteria bacterium]|nr:transglycosylase SLT domain-containing protein [Alphaproteobacteria bacterium]
MPRSLIFATVAAFSLISPAAASMPATPSLKPERPYASRVVSTRDAGTLDRALRAAERGDWREVARLQDRAGAQAVKDLILWRRARAGAPDMSFDELSRAIDRLSGWPRIAAMRVRAEEIIELSALDAGERVEWLLASGPVSGKGHVALARAYSALGNTQQAAQAIRTAWHNHTLDRQTTDEVLARYGNLLSPFDHQRRADFLLWTGQRSAAHRLKPRLGDGWRRLVDARIKLAVRAPGVDNAVRAVPDALQDNPGLLYERAKWRRRRGWQDRATPLLVGIDGAGVPKPGRHRLWDERHIAMRSALKDRDFSTAYALSAPHGLDSGYDFAQAEWAAGWIALRHRDDPARAAKHFRTLGEGVGTPISQSRADYWLGRAGEALSDDELADAAYRGAAQYRYTFYGQLAAEKTGEARIAFDNPGEPTQEEIDAFEARPLVKAMRLLAEAGESRLFRVFAYHLDDALEKPTQYILLKRLADEYQYHGVGVRGAKAGLAKGLVAPDAAYPVVEYPLLREPQVERSLMLALSRQESEMNPRAISHANARGLMQFIPSTARREARLRGLPYRTSWLTDDPGYNMTLGGAHLDTLLEEFNGSYIMATAAYNAGASRPRRWANEYGDPRKGEIDPVDWIEFIPFSETRNYIQRVLENTQVYRHRLSGQEEEIRLSDDLRRGSLR